MIWIRVGAIVALVFLAHAWTANASRCVAHRGNSSEYLENSLSAVVSAWEIGAPAVEFDLHHTADGVALIMHDSRLLRTGRNRSGTRCPLYSRIRNLTFDRIDRRCRLMNGEDIPVLEDVLEFFVNRNMILFIELKDRPSERTFALLESYYRGRGELLRIIAFNTDILKSARDRLRTVDGAEFYHLARKEDQVHLGFDGVSVNKPGDAFVRRVLHGGKRVTVWTVDEVEVMRHYEGLGVHYLTTNRPRACLARNR